MFNNAKKRAWALPLLLAGALLALVPASALAQGGAQLVLYEVIESPPPSPATGGQPGAFIPGPDGSVTRLAQATLTGPVKAAGGSLDSWSGGEVDAYAQSRVDLATGVGPISGSFTVDLASGGAVSGKLDGILDLHYLLQNLAPLAPVSGTWNTLGKSSVGGTFSGVAQVPIECSKLGGPEGYFCYLKPDFSGAELLTANEFNRKGIPLVRFLLGLSAQ
ncbi:MAG: hypothetical protein HYU25_02615 [Candidatus Rokubacteria bacterium]|nr:hypothetical protein [Candidatus Rokubacteria bacterium]